MKNFSIIVAMDEAGGIGKNGDLPWRISKDMVHFKTVTSQASDGKRNAVIMGRKTWESLPDKFRPLPNRINIVLTRDPKRCFDGADATLTSLDDALMFAENNSEVDRIFVIGGAQVYHDAIGHAECSQLYVTQIHTEFKCDVFFPELPEVFQEVSRERPFLENGQEIVFLTYRKK